MTSDGLVIDERKLNHIKLCILRLNVRTLRRRKTNDEMVDSIRKLIMDQVNKKY